MEYVPTKLYEQLLKFKNGEIDANEIDDELISEVSSNGIVRIEFENALEYLKLLPYDESDFYNISIVFSPYYYTPELVSEFHIEDEWDNGYVFQTFDGENDRKFDIILQYLGLTYDRLDSEESRKVIETLDENFSRYTQDIKDKYHELLSESFEEIIRDYVTKETCNIFGSKMIILADCFNLYFTTVDNLIRLFDEYRPKKGQTLTFLLKKIANGDFEVAGDFNEDLYNLNIDKESFNKTVGVALDNIIEKIEDETEFKDISEFREIMKTLSEYKFHMIYQTPKNNNVRFQIFRVDPETNLIRLRVFFNRKDVDGYMTLDNFKLLLHHPELFPLFEE